MKSIHRFEAALVDISVGGAGVLVKHATDKVLARHVAVEFRAQLPGSGAPVRLVARIQSRRLQGKSLIYGLMFDQENSDDYGAAEDAIGQYVATRQREERRKRAV